jgi:carbon-monoxide dehydrogenase medium subunit
MAELQGGRFGTVRLAAGAIGPKPRRLPLAETALQGRRLETATLRDFLSALTAEVAASSALRHIEQLGRSWTVANPKCR